MSITFRSDCVSTITMRQEPCLCAQCCEAFTRMFSDGEDNETIRAELRAAAYPACPRCSGTGVEEVPVSDTPEMDLNLGNAAALFGVLGLNEEQGSLSIHEARRAIMRGRSCQNPSAFLRPEAKIFGKPSRLEDGVVEMRPLRSWDVGLDEEGLRVRVEIFAAFVMAASERGATEIFWG